MFPATFSCYLNDHLAGSTGAMELLETLKHHASDAAVVDLVTHLHHEFTGERMVVTGIIQHLKFTESGLRQTAAWLGQKFLDLKVAVEDKGRGSFYVMESLEALSVGIAGKQLLWMALSDLADNDAKLPEVHYPRLIAQAEDQRRRVESLRVTYARRAFLQ